MKKTTKVAAKGNEVEDYLQQLEHPRVKEIRELRAIILGADATITDCIKWNSPSFRTSDDFATMNLKAKSDEGRIWLVLHTGARSKTVMQGEVADPKGLVKWLAKDRGVVVFDNAGTIKARKSALVALIREWIRHLGR